MQVGDKLSAENFFRHMERMQVRAEHADENLSRVFRLLHRKYQVDHIAYKLELKEYPTEPGFLFYLINNGGTTQLEIAVPYGPQARELITNQYPNRLYFQRKNLEAISQEANSKK